MKSRKDDKPKPGIRVDGGKRRDMNADRVQQRMAGVVKPAQSADDIKAGIQARRLAKEAEHKRVKRLSNDDGGKDGAKLSKVRLRMSGHRTKPQTIRARPGSFEWRYGRNKQGSLFHAGSQFARLWERAGISIPSSADFLKGTKSGFSTGLAEGKAVAIDELHGIVAALGQAPTDRLIAYCVEGATSTELAAKNGVAERSMGAVLELDLKACAQALRFAA